MSNKPPFRLSPLAEQTCSNCPLKTSSAVFNQVTTEYWCGPDKDQPIDVMFVAEGPGASENSKARPAIGRTGRVLRRTVQRLSQGSQLGVAYGNVVRCRPTKKTTDGDAKDRPPTIREMLACRGNILRDIAKLRPKAVVILGDSAARGLVSNRDGTALDPKTKITSIRGKDFLVKLPDGTSIPAVVTYHFSHVFRHPEVASVFREDVGKALRRARGQLSDYSARNKPTITLDTVPKVKGFLGHLLKNLTKEDVVSFDYETDSVNRINNRVLSVAFAYQPDQAYFIPLRHPKTDMSGPELKEVMRLLRAFFRYKNPSFRCLAPHNAKFEELVTMDQFGTHIMSSVEDTFQRAYGLNEDRKDAMNRPYGLKTLAEEQLGFYHYNDKDIARVVGYRNKGELAKVPLGPLAEYNGMDACVGLRLFFWQREWATAEGYAEQFESLSRNMHGQIARVLAEKERNGLLADREQVRALMSDDSDVQKRLRAIEDELVSLDSVKEVNKRLLKKRRMGKGLWGGSDLWIFEMGKVEAKQTLFFDVLGLEPIKFSRKTKAPSMDKAFLKKYKGVREADLYSEHTQLRTIQSRYVKGIYHFLHYDPDMKEDQRLRPHFNPAGTITGRLASKDPNVLNIPRRKKTAAVKAIKRLFIVPRGHVLVCADYSQAEVRWLAEGTQDPHLVRAFQEAYRAKRDCRHNPTAETKRRSKLEGDFHRHTASMVHSVDLSQVTPEQRDAAKKVMFGLVYGQTLDGLASQLGITKKEAEAFIDAFFARFPVAKKWLDDMETNGFRDGFVLSPTGRRKLVNSWSLVGNEDVSSFPRHLRYMKSHLNHVARVCRNAPIQGVASDTNLLACSRLLEHILENGLSWKIINTVYDSIMIEVPFPEAAACVEVTQSIMEDPELLAPFGLHPKVPFAADFSVGVNWGDQYDIAYDEEEWKVVCGDCGGTRKEETQPTNRRCEECGSQSVRRSIVTGPMSLLLQQLDRDHSLSAVCA